MYRISEREIYAFSVSKKSFKHINSGLSNTRRKKNTRCTSWTWRLADTVFLQIDIFRKQTWTFSRQKWVLYSTVHPMTFYVFNLPLGSHTCPEKYSCLDIWSGRNLDRNFVLMSTRSNRNFSGHRNTASKPLSWRHTRRKWWPSTQISLFYDSTLWLSSRF